MTVSRVLLLMVVLWSGAVQACRSATQHDPMDEIAQHLQSLADEGAINGVVLIGQGDDVLFHQAYGPANIEYGIPNTIQSRFPIYSISKQLTASLVLDIAQTGSLSLDAPITEFLPELDNKLTAEAPTLGHLLANSGGVAEAPFDALPAVVDTDMRETIDAYFSEGSDFSPGSRFRYSPFGGYMMLAAAVETALDSDFEAVLQERMLQPLGMNSTGLMRSDIVLERRAFEYNSSAEGVRAAFRIYLDSGNAGAGFYSTAEDLFTWARAVKSGDYGYAGIFGDLTAPRIEADSGQYGYGVYLNALGIEGEEIPIAYHGGSDQHLLVHDLKNDRTFILLNNFEAIDNWSALRSIMTMMAQ